MSSLQNEDQGTHLHLDIQPEDERKACEMDFGWSGVTIAGLIASCIVVRNAL